MRAVLSCNATRAQGRMKSRRGGGLERARGLGRSAASGAGALHHPAVHAQGSAGGGAGQRRDDVDAQVGHLLRLGEAADQGRGAVLGQETGLDLVLGNALIARQVGQEGAGALGPRRAGQETVLAVTPVRASALA
mgnify:CR=1 FL=1